MFKDTKAFSSFSVHDIEKAKEFYGQTLGLNVETTPEGLQLHIGGGAQVFVYASPNNSPAQYTVLNFVVDDAEKAVDQLIAKGLVMEQYDIPPYIKTDAKGIAHSDGSTGPTAMAWFKDPSGNIVGVMQEK